MSDQRTSRVLINYYAENSPSAERMLDGDGGYLAMAEPILDGDDDFANRLYEQLHRRLGDRAVLRASGTHGIAEIREYLPGGPVNVSTVDETNTPSVLSSFDALLPVIGPAWLGRTRMLSLSNPVGVLGDIKAAFDAEIPVIPVLVGGAELPRRDELPGSVVRLADQQSVALADATWDDDLERLIELVDRLPARHPESARRAVPVASMLPPEPKEFVGRERELERLRSVLSGPPDPDRPRPRVAALVGPLGVGKSALAVHAAHTLRDRYPDGQLHASLGARTRATTILARFLGALGVPRSEIPRTSNARSELYESLTSGRRLLVVLDDVHTDSQMLPLLPRDPSCAVLVTSQPRLLPGLGLEDFADAVIELEPLDERDVLTLLRALLVSREVSPATARDVVRQVGALPLTIRLLAQLAQEDPAAELAALARGMRQGEETAVLKQVYESMPAEDQRLFRLLGVLVDPECEVGLAAELAGSSAKDVAVALDRLVDRQLIEASGEGRYRVRDLARELAAERLAAEEPEAERQAAQRRADRWLAIHGDYQPKPRITRDYWTTDDNLGYGGYADAIAAFIRHEETRPPLTIGIKAPWGAGKTSVMRMVQERIDPPANRDPWQPTTLCLTRESRSKLLARADAATKPQKQRRRRWWRWWGGDAEVPGRDAEATRRPREGLGEADSLKAAVGDLAARRQGDPGATSEGSQPPATSRVTVLELLQRTWDRPLAEELGQDPQLDVSAPAAPRLQDPDKDWRPTVWFNPWMYQTGEQIWAGLAYEIISQVTDRLLPGDRERFWLELNLCRIDRQAVRRKIYRVLLERFLPLVFVLALAAVAAVALLLVAWVVPAAAGVLRTVSAAVASLATTAFGAGVIVQVVRSLRQEAAGPFAQLVHEPNLVEGSRRLLAEEARGAVGELIRDPGYESRLGFLYLVQTDMKRVLDLVASEERPLVVLVDDLDRCSPGAVAQVIEAINLFLAGQFPNCVFVLAVEPAMVAAHVQVAYKELVETLKKDGFPGQWSTLGWRFLEKIVQLPLSLPSPNPDDRKQVAGYVDSLLDVASPAQAGVGSGEATAAPAPASLGHMTAVPLSASRPASIESGDGPAGPAATAPDTATAAVPEQATQAEAERAERVRRIEAAIRRQSPTIKRLPAMARAAQDEALGTAGGPLRPETIEASNRVFAELYSDADAREAIHDALRWLESRNPREIKRFVNLFRFYTFIAQQQRLQEATAPTGQQVAKLAVLAIRWPHLLNALGGRPTGEDGSTVLGQLEQHARQRDTSAPPPERRTGHNDALPAGPVGARTPSVDGSQATGSAASADAAPRQDWRSALLEAGLIRDAEGTWPEDLAWTEDLRRFLAEEPSIQTAARLLL